MSASLVEVVSVNGTSKLPAPRSQTVSKGHGIKYHDMLYAPQNMHTIIFNWLNAKFPGKARPVIGDTGKPTGTNGFINGAQGGMGSDYFSMCFREHITDDVDLVLIELGGYVGMPR